MICIGIDYGERRIGLSYGDALGVATPLPAIVEASESDRLDALERVARERRVTDLVFGYPYNMDGSVGFKAKEVDAFIGKLLQRIDLPVHRIDERLTSHEAAAAFPKGRDDALRRSGKLDSAAATLILQDFLSQRVALPELGEVGEGVEEDEEGEVDVEVEEDLGSGGRRRRGKRFGIEKRGRR